LPPLAWDWVRSLPEAHERLQSRTYDVVLVDWANGTPADPDGLRQLQARASGAVVALVDSRHAERASLARACGVRTWWLPESADPEVRALAMHLAAVWHFAEACWRKHCACVQALLDRFPDGLVVSDGGGRLLFVNAAARALWRAAGRELSAESLPADLRPGQTRELTLGDGAGQTLTVECRMAVGQWEEQPARLIFLRDITHRKRNEEQLRLANDKYKQTIRQLADRNTEIQLFYHTLSHELKTPLAAAREFICLVLDGLAGPLTETQREYLEIARDSCDQLRLHVNDLLDVTRLETGKMSIQRRPVALAELLEKVTELMRPEATRRQIQLSWSCEPDLPPALVDAQRIVQVLTNLVGNALKFTPVGGQVRLHAGRHPDQPRELRVSVSDTGPGIPPEHRERIFERLHQLDPPGATGASRAGLGLGLYICRELVKLHGGRIWVESEPGHGSNFLFTLPLEPAPAVREILVADDEAAIRGFLGDFLAQEGFRVQSADSGTRALELLHLRRPDLVILDMVMPGLDGEQTLREIRRHWPDLPVIISSGYAGEELLARLSSLAPFAVVEKPYRPQILLNTIRTLLQ
jgi:signal transduction histidine kinase